MTIRDLKGTVNDRIPIRNVIVSVFDKSGLDNLALGLLELNPDVRFMSSTGSYRALKEILGERADKNLIEVAQYTGAPEMEGGLVKTLHPKIHAGILGERNNPDHQEYLRNMGDGVFIDMVVVNLYPFSKVVADIEAGTLDKKTGKPFNFENARGNIDIGGPTMIRAAAKNFPGCAGVCNPADYKDIVAHVSAHSGCTTFDRRLELARGVFDMTSKYDTQIANYLFTAPSSAREIVKAIYSFSEAA